MTTHAETRQGSNDVTRSWRSGWRRLAGVISAGVPHLDASGPLRVDRRSPSRRKHAPCCPHDPGLDCQSLDALCFSTILDIRTPRLSRRPVDAKHAAGLRLHTLREVLRCSVLKK